MASETGVTRHLPPGRRVAGGGARPQEGVPDEGPVPLQDRRRPVSGKGLSHQVSEDLLVRIAGGEFRPGDKLPGELQLMEEYGVGRNTIREAVRGLVALRVVDVRPRRGATVLASNPDLRLPSGVASALVSDKMTDDLFDMRLIIETEAAARAAGRRDPDELREIRRHHERFHQMMLSGQLTWAADLDFHGAIARATGNSVLPLMLESAWELLAKERFSNSFVRPDTQRVYDEHDGIVVAIEEGRRRDARKLMDDHLSRVARTLKEHRARQD